MVRAKDWLVPGMRNLAQLQCEGCQVEFYEDLPAGQATLTPATLDAQSGEAFCPAGATWFANWLAEGFRRRTDVMPTVTEEVFRPLRRPILLNCLDALYGHELMKLMNAQYYLDNHSDHDLIILIHANFRWLVPDGVAAIWTLDQPMSHGKEWSDALAAFVQIRLCSCDEAWLARAVNLPHGDDFDIARFTRVVPFPRDDFSASLQAMRAPNIVFVCRDDRPWFGKSAFTDVVGRLARALARRGFPLAWLVRTLQHQAIAAVAQILRKNFPDLTFTVVGVGKSGGLPQWIHDRREGRPSAEDEVKVCRVCSQAHLVIGVHGSNMLLPSAHAAAVIDLMPPDRWGNLAQDISLPMGETREQALRAIFLPIRIGPAALAHIAASRLRLAQHVLRLGRTYTRHDEQTQDKLASLAVEAHRANCQETALIAEG